MDISRHRKFIHSSLCHSPHKGLFANGMQEDIGVLNKVACEKENECVTCQ